MGEELGDYVEGSYLREDELGDLLKEGVKRMKMVVGVGGGERRSEEQAR